MTRLPGAIFIVDVMREHIAVKEAQKLNIPIFAMVDTNCDPRPIDFVVPSNDDASKSIDIIMESVTSAVAEGLSERKADKQAEADEEVMEKETTEAPAKKVAAATEESEKEAPAVEETAVEEKETPAEEKKEEGKADDLTKIEGIGPKGAEALVNAGLDSYEKLAGAKPEAIKEILTEASSRMAHLDPTSWPKQAKMAADGEWDKLKDWQDKAKAGVE
jgi:small subunit ribosomal protein S2